MKSWPSTTIQLFSILEATTSSTHTTTTAQPGERINRHDVHTFRLLILAFIVRSQWNGFVLDLQGGGITQTTRVIAAPMNSYITRSSTQLWFFDADRSIRSVPADLVIDIDGGIYSTNLHLYVRYIAQNQEFIFNNSYIICPYSNAAMTMDYTNTTAVPYVTSRPLNFSVYQRWNVSVF